MGDFGGVEEGFAEFVTLFFAERCEKRVWDTMVFDAQVMETLRMAD